MVWVIITLSNKEQDSSRVHTDKTTTSAPRTSKEILLEGPGLVLYAVGDAMGFSPLLQHLIPLLVVLLGGVGGQKKRLTE